MMYYIYLYNGPLNLLGGILTEKTLNIAKANGWLTAPKSWRLETYEIGNELFTEHIPEGMSLVSGVPVLIPWMMRYGNPYNGYALGPHALDDEDRAKRAGEIEELARGGKYSYTLMVMYLNNLAWIFNEHLAQVAQGEIPPTDPYEVILTWNALAQRRSDKCQAILNEWLSEAIANNPILAALADSLPHKSPYPYSRAMALQHKIKEILIKEYGAKKWLELDAWQPQDPYLFIALLKLGETSFLKPLENML